MLLLALLLISATGVVVSRFDFSQTCSASEMGIAHAIWVGILAQIHFQDELPGSFVVLLRPLKDLEGGRNAVQSGPNQSKISMALCC